MGQVEAVIISGGFGTRMLPLTERHPKHLLTVGGVPFLEHQLTKLAAAGVAHVVLATSYHAEAFVPVLGDGSRFGLSLVYVRESEPLGTGGAIRNVADALSNNDDGAVIILNGDVLSGHDVTAQLADFERPRNGRQVGVSLHLVEVGDARPFGCVPTDTDGRVLEFTEKSDNPVTNQVNAGCYIFRRRVIDTIQAGRVVSVERETFPGLVADDELVVGYLENAYWRDVGSPEALVAASADIVTGRAPTTAITIEDPRCLIHPDADNQGTVDGGSVLDARSVVGPDAVVTSSVLMAGARVGARATVIDSVLGPGAVVEQGATVTGAALGDDAVVSAGLTLAPGTKLACGERV